MCRRMDRKKRKFLLTVLGFEFTALSLLGRCSTMWSTPQSKREINFKEFAHLTEEVGESQTVRAGQQAGAREEMLLQS
jgi:hypothetical protein